MHPENRMELQRMLLIPKIIAPNENELGISHKLYLSEMFDPPLQKIYDTISKFAMLNFSHLCSRKIQLWSQLVSRSQASDFAKLPKLSKILNNQLRFAEWPTTLKNGPHCSEAPEFSRRRLSSQVPTLSYCTCIRRIAVLNLKHTWRPIKGSNPLI